MLLADAERVTLCLRADQQVIGFATGYLTHQHGGQVDGVYVTPGWRRQYWGSRLLEALQTQLETLGASEVRAVLRPAEKQQASFLNNLFWQNSARILTPSPLPTLQSALVKLKTEFQQMRRSSTEEVLEIPRQIL